MEDSPRVDEGLRTFVRTVLQSEHSCVDYLRQYGIFAQPPQLARGVMEKCATRRWSNAQKTELQFGVVQIGSVQLPVPFLQRMTFFMYTYPEGRLRRQLRLCDIVTIVWLWCYSSMPTSRAAKAAEVSKNTLISWYAACREVCSRTETALPKMLGTPEEPIQVDESYFSGRRKYNRGRLRKGDRQASNEAEAQEELEIELGGWGSADPSEDENEEFDGPPIRRRNYGSRVVGPWVVGLYKNRHEVRFFIVPDRRSETLRDIIRRSCEVGSIIETDEWRGYSRLCEDGFIHNTVNHSRWFIDPVSGANTQGIERMWIEAKSIMRAHRRPNHCLQSHLDEVAWRMRNKNSDNTMLECFWKDVARIHELPLSNRL